MKSVTLYVPQGIGDIFWIYQKVAPYFDVINFGVLAVDEKNPVQQRALAWLPLLPKVGRVGLRACTPENYDASIASVTPMASLLALHEEGQEFFHYAVNRPLEDGIRLEEIDPGYRVEWNVELKGVPEEEPSGIEDWARPHPGPLPQERGKRRPKYAVVYVSGSTTERYAIAQDAFLFGVNGSTFRQISLPASITISNYFPRSAGGPRQQQRYSNGLPAPENHFVAGSSQPFPRKP